MALALSVGKCTLLGNYRENNEDAIDVKAFPDMTICLVADGMGGQAAGEVASKRATEIIPRELKKHVTGIVGVGGPFHLQTQVGADSLVTENRSVIPQSLQGGPRGSSRILPLK